MENEARQIAERLVVEKEIADLKGIGNLKFEYVPLAEAFMRTDNKCAELKDHLRWALRWVPRSIVEGDNPKGLSPMFYHTLSQRCDAKQSKRYQVARAALDEGGRK